MKIVTDSSVMFSVEQGAQHGIEVLPLTVTIAGKTWLEYEEISSAEFLRYIAEGGIPTSSCPPPALTLEAYDTDEEVLHLTMADGLSGSYEVAQSLKPQAKHPDRVHVLNSQTLCVPHRVLAFRAMELAGQGVDASGTVQKLRAMIDSVHSYLVPEDFGFLRRGGRLTPIAAKFAALIKAVPVLKQTDDGKRLEKLTVARSLDKAIAAIGASFEKEKVNAGYYLSVSHADNAKLAQDVLNRLLERVPFCRHGIFDLGPAFITQGGPGCIAVQVIDLRESPELSFA